MTGKTGILIINTGSPATPAIRDVRAYLKKFLSDPRVMTMPAPLRMLLLHLFILPFRPRRSSQAYRAIWQPEGAPLVSHTRHFSDRLAALLPDRFSVRYAMRFGKPEIGSVISEFLEQGISRLILFPLFPQYASSSTGSAVEYTYSEICRRASIPALCISTLPPFYAEEEFQKAAAHHALEFQRSISWDHVLFSFHGLPESHIRRSESLTGHCLQAGFKCCSAISWENRNCYRAQCMHTARSLANAMNIEAEKFTVSFQSRLGRGAWLKPYTQKVLQQLAAKGCKSLLVLCPSFVTDGLESLYELGMEGREIFRKAGGGELHLVPCLNDSIIWAEAAKNIILKHIKD